jgi:hypothetical protein
MPKTFKTSNRAVLLLVAVPAIVATLPVHGLLRLFGFRGFLSVKQKPLGFTEDSIILPRETVTWSIDRDAFRREV